MKISSCRIKAELVGMKTGSTTKENSVEILQKMKMYLLDNWTIGLPGIYANTMEF